MNIYPLQLFRNLKITAKFILSFLLVSLVPLSISIYISYNSSRKALKQEVANSLFAVADNKANQIEAYLLTQKQNGITLSGMPEIMSALDIFASRKDGIDYNAISKEYRSVLKYYQKLFGYDDIFIVNPDGEIIFSAEGVKSAKSLYEIALVKKSKLADCFIRAKASQDTEISDFEYYPLDNKAIVFIASPVFKEGSLIGLVIVEMNNQGLYSFVQDYTGLGKTGETILASKIDDEAVIITPLRFDTRAGFERKIKIGSTEGLDIQKALQGDTGSGVSFDYRDQQVLVVRRYLPTFRLGMVVKMDTDEVFASAAKLRNRLLGISFALLLMVVIMALVIAYSISKPIKELTETSKIISAGDLSARAEMHAEDEIGELAASFNQMTNNLVSSKINVEQKKVELEEQKRLLEEANIELRELDNLKSDFVNTVSHELRTPLTTIREVISQIQEGLLGETTPEQKKFLSICLQDVNRLRRIIDNLLDIAKLEAGKFKIILEEADIVEIAKGVIASFNPKSSSANLEIREKFFQEKAIACVSRDSIIQVFTNLIGNAFKFTDKGFIEVSVKDDTDYVECSVADTGRGISEVDLPKLFSKFQQFGRRGVQGEKGTGLGLSICKNIIELHHGKIWVESVLNKGTKFTFTLPKYTAKEEKA